MSRSSKRNKDEQEVKNAVASKRAKKEDEPEPAVAVAAVAAAAAADASKPPPKKRAPVAEKLNPNDPLNFNHFLFDLIAFRSDNNNFHVSKEDQPQLHSWLQHLKREYKNYVQDPATSQLIPEQLNVLEYLHVPLTSRGDDHWNRFHELLKQYGDRHGHVLVPRLCEVPGLGDWVTDQRRQYKAWKQGQSTQLTKERREKLEAIGFAWQVRNRPEWDARFTELVEYKEKHGDCKVPQHFKENKALGKWVAKQREQYKLLKKGQHSFLTPYRLEKLNSVGFVWQVRTSLDNDDADFKLAEPLPGQVPGAPLPGTQPAPAPAAAAAAAPASPENPPEHSAEI